MSNKKPMNPIVAIFILAIAAIFLVVQLGGSGGSSSPSSPPVYTLSAGNHSPGEKYTGIDCSAEATAMVKLLHDSFQYEYDSCMSDVAAINGAKK